MKRQSTIIFIVLVFLSGCATRSFNGPIKPIYPEISSIALMGESWSHVDSLTPTFRWESSAKYPCTYDFAIWDKGEKVTDNSGVGTKTTTYYRPPIYYKESIVQTEHTVEIPLAPSTVYYWSVRIRIRKDNQDKVSSWATYNYQERGGATSGGSTGMNYLFEFITPKADKNKNDEQTVEPVPLKQ